MLAAIMLFWLFGCLAAGFVAQGKGRSFIGFFMLAFFFTPLLGIIFSLCVSPVARELNIPPADPAQLKKCPYCAETIKMEAIACRHCGRDLPMPKEAVAAES